MRLRSLLSTVVLAAHGLPHLPVGTQVRILPNHACPTAAQYDCYNVLGTGHEITATWPRVRGW
jgi:D-serine deaminase-like pyridoxal phosphate-dependent protein